MLAGLVPFCMRDLFTVGLEEIGLQFTRSQGAYYVPVDISEFGYESDLAFCEDLTRKVGVGAVPGSSFLRNRKPFELFHKTIV